MIRTLGLFAMSACLALGVWQLPLAQADSTATKQAQVAADSWLALVDAGKYGKSWDDAASSVKILVKKREWVTKLGGTRQPMGKVLSRNLKILQYTKTLPGAPDGEYVFIQYQVSFENKKSAVETVTPMKDKDGNWRVSGYYIN